VDIIVHVVPRDTSRLKLAASTAPPRFYVVHYWIIIKLHYLNAVNRETRDVLYIALCALANVVWFI